MEVAKTILEQMGGNKLIVMTGARNFVAHEDGLSFKLPKKSKGVNYVKITLNSLDLYDVEYGCVKKFDYKKVNTSNNIYNDMLCEDFESNTGLYTKLF